MTTSTGLRTLLTPGRLIVAPGVFNALTARLAESAGFEAIYLTGYGTAASKFGLPDLGLVTMTEMLDTLRAITAAVDIPLIVDGDTGYGNPINVVRLVKEYEKAGAAAIHIEDQVWPKRCGHMAGKQVIPREDMVAKIRAAVDTRKNDGLIIIARTDALAVEGWDWAVERCQAYVDAGADVAFIDALETVEQVEAMPGQFRVPCMINLGPRTPALPVKRLEALGYRIAIFPAVCLGPAVLATSTALKELKETGQHSLGDFMAVFAEFNELLGVPGYHALEEKYRSAGMTS